MCEWISSFLNNRYQTVVLKGFHSHRAPIVSGVPQGTVIGPILFILFINDFENNINHSSVRFFADDTRISKRTTCEQDTVKLQEDLDAVIKWSYENNMKLHKQKFDLIIHRANPKFLLHELPFTNSYDTYKVSNGEELLPVDTLRDLEVMVTEDLSWSQNIHSLVKRGTSISAWILSVFLSREKTVMMTLYKSLVRSHLEYCLSSVAFK